MLLWAEASTVGVASSLINVPTAITVGDGGIDAAVDARPTAAGQGIIESGINRYQIKTGEFSLTPSYLRDLLGRPSDKDELNTRIKSCLDAGGRFVVVLFGWDNPDRTDEECRNTIIEYVKAKWGYVNPSIAVWRQNQICSFFSRYPSLALAMKANHVAQFEQHGIWVSHTDMQVPYVGGPRQNELISQIRALLRRDSSSVHIHLFGEPGIGKTRLALEATNTADLSPLVLYIDSPKKLGDGFLLSEITREDNEYRCILVIDECPHGDSAYLWNRLRSLGQRVKLLTIYNDSTIMGGETNFLEAPLLSEDQIKDILQQYGLESMDARRWSDFCGGSPRVAHLLGSNLRSNPEDVLRQPDNVPVWDRFITGGDDSNAPDVQRRTMVLRCVSLFRRFGYSPEFKNHISAIVTKIRDIDATITEGQVSEAIASLKRRRILQGEYVLYITPRLLHLYLLADWFRRYGVAYNQKTFVAGLPDDLADWHREMFQYAGEQPEIDVLIKGLLGPTGVFPSIEELDSNSGSRFFFALTNANAEAGLACLERTLANADHTRLLKFENGRRYIVWSLERIVVWKDLFEAGARLLMKLARAETESVANNATGVFADLYSPGYGRLAPTELPPIERIPLLVELIESGQKVDISIAVKACDKALESQGITRMVGPEYQGLRRTPDFWLPKTWGELYEYYGAVWGLLSTRCLSLDAESAKLAVAVLLRKARGLAQIEYLTSIIQDTIASLGHSDVVDKEELIKVIAHIIHFDRKRLHPDTAKKWKEIYDSLVGSDFGSLLRRYVGMNVLEDSLDEKGNLIDKSREKIAALALEAIKTPALLDAEYAWLLTDKAVRGGEFGYELGVIDTAYSFLTGLIDRQKNAENAAFLGGYFAALFDRDTELWEKTLDDIAKIPEKARWVPELTRRSRITDRAALRILDLANSGIIGPDDMELFSYGGQVKRIDESIFMGWLRYLLSIGKGSAIVIGLQLHHAYYVYPKAEHYMPRDLTLELILHDSLFDTGQSNQWAKPMANYEWEVITEVYINQYPDSGPLIAKKYMKYFGMQGTIIGGYHDSTQKIINSISQNFPHEVWTLAANAFGPPESEVAFNISQWLRGGQFYPAPEGALYFFSPKDIWDWVDSDRMTRALYLAALVPPSLVLKNGRMSLAREMLVRYGDLESVRNEFHANYRSEGFTGPGSLHFRKKKQVLQEFKGGEKDPNVLRWVDEAIESLEATIKMEKIEEEHRGF